MTGRRERNKQDKHERILAAARELFTRNGVSAVTTQQISERADVAAGTLFRYAATKGELILMVHNEAFADALAAGQARASDITAPAEAVFAIVEPVLALGLAQGENTAAYQRELMFGAIGEPHHTRGLQIIESLVAAVATVIERACVEFPDARHRADTAARAVFAVLHLTLVAANLPSSAPQTGVRDQIDQIVRGATSTDVAGA